MSAAPSARWRELARAYERDGCLVRGDLLLRRCADDLEAWLSERDNALLTPKEAAAECGLAEGTIRKKLADGRLPNEGGPRSPRVRRSVLHDTLAGRRRLAVVR